MPSSIKAVDSMTCTYVHAEGDNYMTHRARGLYYYAPAWIHVRTYIICMNFIIINENPLKVFACKIIIV